MSNNNCALLASYSYELSITVLECIEYVQTAKRYFNCTMAGGLQNGGVPGGTAYGNDECDLEAREGPGAAELRPEHSYVVFASGPQNLHEHWVPCGPVLACGPGKPTATLILTLDPYYVRHSQLAYC